MRAFLAAVGLATLAWVAPTLAADGTMSVPPVKPLAPVTAALPAMPNAPAGAVAVLLDAIIAVGGKPLVEPIAWTVVKAEGGETVAQENGASPKFALAPGRYKVTAEIDQTKVTKELLVGTSSGKQTINLNAAYLTVKMIPYTGAPAIADDVTWELYVYAGGATENGKKIASATAPTEAYILPAGAYVVRGRYDASTADLVVPLQAGQGYNYTVNLYAGLLDARAVLPSGADLSGQVTWEILKAKPDQDGKRQQVAWITGKKHAFTLREGRYVVIARESNSSTMETVDIVPGKTKKLKLVLKPNVDQAPASPAIPTAATTGG
jgi:hypothetical protein